MPHVIQTSLDWSEVQLQLEEPLKHLSTDKSKMLRISSNIGRMVVELGNEEIKCRRLQMQTTQHKKLLNKINTEIANFEQLTVLGLLCS